MADWKARSGCPQCGGEVDMEVGDHLLECPWCRTRLYIASSGPLTYRIDPAPEYEGDETLFHLPYWRLRGLRYAVFSDPAKAEVIGRLVDLTAPATRFLPLGANLGIRPQAAPLTLSLTETRAIAPDLQPERIADESRAGLAPVQEPGLLFSEMIGEGRVLLHAPFVLERTPEWCRERAREIGPSCLGLVEALQGDRVSLRHRAVQGIVRLGERYGEARLEAACRRALAFDHLQYRAVKTILENGLDAIEETEPSFDRLSGVYLGGGHFCRNLKNLLLH